MTYTIIEEDIAWCPACDQGWVHHIAGPDGFICSECEAFWEEVDSMSAENLTQFSQVESSQKS